MIKNTKKLLKPLIFASLLLGLTACSGVPSLPSLPSFGGSAAAIQDDSADIKQANKLLQQGKNLEAADAYYKASQNRSSPRRERLVLQAAEIATSVKDKSLAQHYLSKVNSSGLSNENSARYRYVSALIALLNDNHRAALNILPKQRTNISTGLWNKIQRVRQQASIHVKGDAQGQSNQDAVLPKSSNRVAVLLPLSGRLGAVGNTILKGIRTSQQNLAPETVLKVYDVASQDVLQQYTRAVREGAHIIIGPLDKRKLAKMVKQWPRLSRPVISLNHLSEGQAQAPASLYQFGLDPEDEARQVAHFAVARGQRRAAMLTPDSQWGRRLAAAFKRMYTSKGGQIISQVSYPNTNPTYSDSVRQLFSTGRGNIDMIFVAASPTQARLIRPMIHHRGGKNIPIYATSHIYSGQPNPGKNRDLDGMIYTEIPYIIEASQIGQLSDTTTNGESATTAKPATPVNLGRYPRLFAMGADSLLIAKNLYGMSKEGQVLQGKTGDIRLGGNRLLQRRLGWATFTNGVTTSYGE